MITGTPDTSVRITNNYVFTPSASDIENDTLTFGITNQPGWTTFDANSGSLTGVPEAEDIGTYSDVIISVTDGQDGRAEAFSIEVLGNASPEITGSPETRIAEAQILTLPRQCLTLMKILSPLVSAVGQCGRLLLLKLVL